MGASVPTDDVPQRVVDGLEKHLRCPLRRLNPDRISESAGIFDCAPGPSTHDPDLCGASGGLELIEDAGGVSFREAGGDSILGQRTERPEQVVNAVHTSDLAVVYQALQFELHRLHDLVVQ